MEAAQLSSAQLGSGTEEEGKKREQLKLPVFGSRRETGSGSGAEHCCSLHAFIFTFIWTRASVPVAEDEQCRTGAMQGPCRGQAPKALNMDLESRTAWIYQDELHFGHKIHEEETGRGAARGGGVRGWVEEGEIVAFLPVLAAATAFQACKQLPSAD